MFPSVFLLDLRIFMIYSYFKGATFLTKCCLGLRELRPYWGLILREQYLKIALRVLFSFKGETHLEIHCYHKILCLSLLRIDELGR